MVTKKETKEGIFKKKIEEMKTNTLWKLNCVKKQESTGTNMMTWAAVYVVAVGKMLMPRLCPQGVWVSQLDKLDARALAKFPANSSEQSAWGVQQDGVLVVISR